MQPEIWRAQWSRYEQDAKIEIDIFQCLKIQTIFTYNLEYSFQNRFRFWIIFFFSYYFLLVIVDEMSYQIYLKQLYRQQHHAIEKWNHDNHTVYSGGQGKPTEKMRNETNFEFKSKQNTKYKSNTCLLFNRDEEANKFMQWFFNCIILMIQFVCWMQKHFIKCTMMNAYRYE